MQERGSCRSGITNQFKRSNMQQGPTDLKLLQWMKAEVFKFRTAQLCASLFQITNYKKRSSAYHNEMFPRQVKTNDAPSSHIVLEKILDKKKQEKTMQLSKTARSQQPDAIKLHIPLSETMAVNVFNIRDVTPYGCVNVLQNSCNTREMTKNNVLLIHHQTVFPFLKQYSLIGVKIASFPHQQMRSAFRLSKKCLGPNKVTHSLASDECLQPLSPPQ